MNANEILNLPQSGLVDIGAHTITHPILSALSEEEQYDEIIGSKTELESALDKPVNKFGYPYGAAVDLIPQTLDIALQSGFRAACTKVSGVVTKGHDPMALPRRAMGGLGFGDFRTPAKFICPEEIDQDGNSDAEFFTLDIVQDQIA